MRKDLWPPFFCSGCGNYVILGCITRAIDELGLDLNKVTFVSGIGCAGWIPTFINADVLHTTHGRALSFATGLKMAKPELEVIVLMGDGDCCSIGGNHLIHTARRNVDLTAICVNNMIYGMTGGQVSPTTPLRSRTPTTPYGNIERPLDLCRVATVAGATFVARWTTAHPRAFVNSLKKGVRKRGFAFVEVVSQCPTRIGRLMGMRTGREMIQWLKERAVDLRVAKQLSEEKLTNKIVVGEFRDVEDIEFVDELRKIIVSSRTKDTSAS